VRSRPLLVAGAALALIVVVLIGGRAAWRLAFRLTGPPPPRQTDVALIADWMSVPYVGRAYRVPEPELFRALAVEREGHRMRPLREIASETGRSSDEVLEIVRETVTTWQSTHPGRRTPIGVPSPPPLLPRGQGGTGPDGARPPP